ncbi:MAG: hypothetical protein LC122_13350 [Chitinophagales bacterium]|nr:hypothetical protein [Chitinophagales bacterium]
MNKIKLNELNQLINVRNYISVCINSSFSVEKKKINRLSAILKNLDDSIVDQIIEFSDKSSKNEEGK